jgi:hypothetical protein
MLSSNYIEDIFVDFCRLAIVHQLPIQRTDQTAIDSFHDNFLLNQQITQNQANYILKILHKYRNVAAMHGHDYSNDLTTPKWKNSFRVLDISKRIYVEEDSDGMLNVCMKFPYQLKKAFEDEILNGRNESVWDPEEKVRKLPVYSCNTVVLFDFAKKHGFEIDDNFMLLLGQVEEIWQNQEKIIPKSIIENNEVLLINANESALAYWNENKTNNIANDLLLAKSMGYRLETRPNTAIERLAHVKPNSFWIKTNSELLDLCNQIDGKICIVLDRVGNAHDWLKKFANDVEIAGIDSSLVKVCFRADKEDKTNFNQWVKEKGFGGSVETGKFLIFNHKPAKWLFKDSTSVKILVSNNLYPSTNQITRDLFNSHPCVIYVGDIKPSETRNQNIVEL